ncbi:MAG TPA: PDZ domain-containing protein [Planctomycetota bacterium]|nr:PDZ domain-containing protein [Planctomycetota bacterium]
MTRSGLVGGAIALWAGLAGTLAAAQTVRPGLRGSIPLLQEAPAATLGFSYRTIPDDLANEIGVEGGVEVRAVASGGPAAQGGLKKGDIVRKVNGRRVDTARQYQTVLGSIRPGDAVVLGVVRERKELELRLQAGERP